MKQLDELIEELGLENKIKVEDIPDIDLYMDQVTQLFENKFQTTKRYEDDKILTKTMINNYAKGKLLFPIKNKKYSKEHLMLINFIYQLKGALSINDIKSVLEKVNKQVEHDEIDLSSLYRQNQAIYDELVYSFKDDVTSISGQVNEKAGKLEDVDAAYAEQLLLITALVNRSNMYRKLAEKLVDQVKETNHNGE